MLATSAVCAQLGVQGQGTVHVVQVLVDPEAAAQRKVRKQQRRAAGKMQDGGV